MVRSARTGIRLVSGGLLVAALLGTHPITQPATRLVGSAPSDDLHGRKHKVERQIAGASRDLDESSTQVRRAAAALERARTGLGAARVELAGTRRELAAAQRLDRATAASLATAVVRLVQAREQLVEARRSVSDQHDTLGSLAASTYQNGDPSLMGLSMVLTSQDPTALTGQLNAVDSVLDKQTAVLAGLQASQAVQTATEHELARARAEVARARQAAAANLDRRQRLEEQASSAEAAVHRLVSARAGARQRAGRALAADQRQLAGLQRERRHITEVLARRAAAARARAAAAGRAAAGGPVVGTGVLAHPVAGPVTSPFGWRIHPIFGYRSLHDGIDFGAACGTPIHAAAGGQVLEEYASAAWGNRLIIDHGLHHGVQLATISNHLSGYAVGVGAHVRRGQVVGYVGTTGWSTGCHLHFTVLQNGVAVNPDNWF